MQCNPSKICPISKNIIQPTLNKGHHSIITMIITATVEIGIIIIVVGTTTTIITTGGTSMVITTDHHGTTITTLAEDVNAY